MTMSICLSKLCKSVCHTIMVHTILCFATFLLQRYAGTYYSFNSLKEDDTSGSENHSAASMNYLSMEHENGVLPHQLNMHQCYVCTIMRNHDINEGLVKTARWWFSVNLKERFKFALLNCLHLTTRSAFLPWHWTFPPRIVHRLPGVDNFFYG